MSSQRPVEQNADVAMDNRRLHLPPEIARVTKQVMSPCWGTPMLRCREASPLYEKVFSSTGPFSFGEGYGTSTWRPGPSVSDVGHRIPPFLHQRLNLHPVQPRLQLLGRRVFTGLQGTQPVRGVGPGEAGRAGGGAKVVSGAGASCADQGWASGWAQPASAPPQVQAACLAVTTGKSMSVRATLLT